MPEYVSHNEYVQSARRQVVDTAKAMLSKQSGFLVGARRLSALRYEVDVEDNDADFLTFVAIDSDTDALPLGETRHHWSEQALAKLEPEIRSAEAWAARVGRQACISLIMRFADQEPE